MATVSYRIRGEKESVAIKIRFRIWDEVEYEISTWIEIKIEIGVVKNRRLETR